MSASKILVSLVLLLVLGAAAFFFFQGGETQDSSAYGGFGSGQGQAAKDARDGEITAAKRAQQGGSADAGRSGVRSTRHVGEQGRSERLGGQASLRVKLLQAGRPLVAAKAILFPLGAKAHGADSSLNLVLGSMPGNEGKPLETDAQSDREGLLAISDLRPARYRLGLAHDDVPQTWRSKVFVLEAGKAFDLGQLELPQACGIKGRVSDAAGSPVADALVTLRPKGFFGFQEGDAHDGLQGKTGRDGRFEILRQAASDAVLVVDHAQYRRFTQVQHLEAGKYLDVGLLQLERGRRVNGTIVDSQGRAIAAAMITPHERTKFEGQEADYFANERAVQSDAAGAFALDGLPEHVELLVSAKGFSQSKRVLKDDERSVQIVLHSRPGVSGVVKGQGSHETMVSLQSLAGEGGAKHSTLVQADGRFSFSAIKAGRYRIIADAKGFGASRARLLDVPAAGLNGLQLKVEAGPSLLVELHDAKGRPVAGARVLAMPASERAPDQFAVISNGKSALRRSAKSDEHGLARLDGLWQGQLDLRIEHAEFLPQRLSKISLVAGENKRRITLKTGAWIVGRVVDDRGQPVAKARVQVHKYQVPGKRSMTIGVSSMEFEDTNFARSDAQGQFRLGPLGAGDWVVNATRPRSPSTSGTSVMMFSGPKGDGVPVRVQTQEGGEAKVEIKLPRAATISGFVRHQGRPVPAARVFARKAKARGLEALMGPETKTDVQGHYRLEGLTPGAWKLAAKPAEGPIATRAKQLELQTGQDLQHDIAIGGGVVTGRIVVAATPGSGGSTLDKFEVLLVDAQGKSSGSTVAIRLATSDGSGETKSGGMVLRSPGQPDPVKPARDGSFRIDFVPEGKWTLQLREGESKRHEQDVEVRDGVLLALGDIKVGASFPVRLELLDAVGKPLAMVMLRIYAAQKGSSGSGSKKGQRKEIFSQFVEGGKCRVPGLAPGRYEIELQPVGPGTQDAKAQRAGTLVVASDGSVTGSKLRLKH